MLLVHPTDRQEQSGIAADADRLLVPIPDACNLLGIRRTKIYGLLASGDLTGVHLGARHLVTMAKIGRAHV